jgi:hypothetical protein
MSFSAARSLLLCEIHQLALPSLPTRKTTEGPTLLALEKWSSATAATNLVTIPMVLEECCGNQKTQRNSLTCAKHESMLAAWQR